MAYIKVSAGRRRFYGRFYHQYSIRMNSELKAQADALFAELGMNLSTTFNIFVRQSLREGGIPFEINLNQAQQGNDRCHAGGRKDCKGPVCKEIHRYG